MKVFLGGTVPGYPWRKDAIKYFEKSNIDYFNPVVDDWNDAAYDEEERQKWTQCNVHLYVITPFQEGFYSFAEIIDSAHLAKQRGDIVTIYSFFKEFYGMSFNDKQIKSLEAIGKTVKRIGGTWFDKLDGTEEGWQELNARFTLTQTILKMKKN